MATNKTQSSGSRKGAARKTDARKKKVAARGGRTTSRTAAVKPQAKAKTKGADVTEPATAKSKPKSKSKSKSEDGGAERRASRARSEEAARRVAMAAAEGGLDKKAANVEIIDVRGKVDYADYVVVFSGRSDRQVGAIARGVEELVREREGVRCIGVEGLPQGSWVLMDFGDVIVHIFHEDTRGYYDLESLWIDAARVTLDESLEQHLD